MTNKRKFFLVLVILSLTSYLWSVPSIPAKNLPNIILISLDTLRADHLGIYGYPRNTSPHIDAFSKESVVFEKAVVQSPWTLPSHMSIMTSLYPSFHGVTNKSSRLADEHTTIAEVLKKIGYQTAAFTDGGLVSGEFGFNQGFDVYEDEWIGIANILPKVEKWLDSNGSKPFFLFIHCYDIHEPYNPPPPYNSIFHDFAYSGNLVPSTTILTAARKGQVTVTSEDLRHFIALYDGGIRYTDEKVGEFLSYLQDAELYDQSLIIITSDHGEEFNEHGSFLHWQLYYNPNLHVPLIMHIPGYPKREIRINELVQSIDLLPTIIDLAGQPPHHKAQGRSLLPSIKRKKNLFKRMVQKVFKRSAKHSSLSFAENEINEIHLWTVVTPSAYQLIDNSESRQLFNLETDPLAKTNIINDRSDLAAELLLQYNQLYSTTSQHISSALDLNEQTRKQLEALGYIDPSEQVPDNPDDTDGDGITNIRDNCPSLHNPGQEDDDGDRAGNPCDTCPTIFNPGQENRDGDWIGDACDECIDTDWDGYGNPGFENTCDDDNCPYVFNPSQADADGDGRGDVCASFKPEYYRLEAEDTDTDGGEFRVAYHRNASQGKFIHTPNGKGNHYLPGTTTGVVFAVSILQPGAYVLWGRVHADNEGNNSFFVQVDNGLHNLWEIEPGRNWHWDAVNNRRKADPAQFNLTEGVHTITIKVREDGTKLDKMILTNDISFVPSDAGGSAED